MRFSLIVCSHIAGSERLRTLTRHNKFRWVNAIDALQPDLATFQSAVLKSQVDVISNCLQSVHEGKLTDMAADNEAEGMQEQGSSQHK